jgi:Tfp pilus assembly protein FimT
MTWNGSAWTEVNDLNSARNRFMGQAIGTQTAALAVEGEGVAGTESWNGTSWTEVNDLNTPRHLGGGSGIQTSAIVSSGRGGPPGYTPVAVCESWDGSSWTEVADVSSARAYLSSAGTAAGNTNSESVIFGGATTSSTANTAATEEWNAEDFTINPVTTS